MNALSFALALGVIAVPAAWLVSALSLLALPFVRRMSPAVRADVAAWFALSPLAVAAALASAVAVPSLLFGLGLGPDHCAGHEHHAHVCLWHGVLLPPWLACVGAVAWALTSVRLGHALGGLVRAERLSDGLGALGVERDGVRILPSAHAVCHVVGTVRPRLVVSEAVVNTLTARELRAALAHERAHLERSDPHWSALIDLAACVAPLTAPAWSRVWHTASEHAADDTAASETDRSDLAEALVAVARLGLSPLPGAALVGAAIEQRVQRLLDGGEPPRRGRTYLGAIALLAMVGITVAAVHGPLHHGVEELWEHVVAK